MKDIPLSIIQEKNKLYSDGAWILLLDVTLLDTPATVLRFARNKSDVVYNSNTYSACNFVLGGIKESTSGGLPSISLTIGNASRPLAAYLEEPQYFSGASIVFTPVNSKYLTEDYSEFQYDFTIGSIQETAKFLTIQLGGYGALLRKFPPDKFHLLHCRFHFRRGLCGYTPKDIAAITFPSGTPVSVQVTTHGFSTGDNIRLETTGITGLDSNYTITKTDANNFTLDGTDGDDYTGPYVSGGKAGYHRCTRILTACRDRENSGRYGAFSGLRSGVGLYGG